MQVKPMMRILSETQKAVIHESAVRLLSKTGVVVQEPRALQIYSDAGATVDGERVRISGELLEKCVEQAPKTVLIFNREGDVAMKLGTEEVYFGAHGDTQEIWDMSTGLVRPYKLNDAAEIARLCDALENIDFLSQNGFADDVRNPRIITPLVFAQMMRNTVKPLGVGCYDVDTLKWILETACVVRSDLKDLARRPFFYHYSEPTSPLAHSAPSLRRLMMAVEHGIPLVYTPMVMSGATGPATMAGVIVQALAESLSGIVLAQTLRPGAPSIIGGIPTMMDMSTTICSYGAPEMVLMAATLTEMAKFYKLPMFGTAGCTDAPGVDMQAAGEAVFSCLSAALSGAHLVHDVGLLYHAERVGAEYFVLCNEVIAMVRSFMRGMEFNAEALAVELIENIGPMGNFVTEQHTLDHFRRFWRAPLFDRSMKGQSRKSDDMAARLKERTRQLMQTHNPKQISDQADKELTGLEQRLRSEPAGG